MVIKCVLVLCILVLIVLPSFNSTLLKDSESCLYLYVVKKQPDKGPGSLTGRSVEFVKQSSGIVQRVHSVLSQA